MRAPRTVRSTSPGPSRSRRWVPMVLGGACLLGAISPAATELRAADPAPDPASVAGRDTSTERVDRRQWEAMVRKASEYLVAKEQAEDGSFSAEAGPGVTALVLTSLLRTGRPPEDPAVARGLKHLESFVREDGGVYREGSLYGNYETCLAILCFSEANQDGRYRELIARADAYVKGIQWDEDEAWTRRTCDMGERATGRTLAPISPTPRS
jgi:hypothetical protein